MTLAEWQNRLDACETQAEYEYLMSVRPKGAKPNAALTGRQGAGLGIVASGGVGADFPLLSKLNSPPRRGRLPRAGG